MNEPLRADVLIAAARLEAGLNDGAEGEYPSDLVERLADALEAATGGQHIDAKHWAEVGRLRSRVAELEAELEEAKTFHLEEYRQLSRLHEIATERTVQLSAIIEKALGEARASSIPLGMPEAMFYSQMLRRVESTLAEYRSGGGLRQRRASAEVASRHLREARREAWAPVLGSGFSLPGRGWAIWGNATIEEHEARIRGQRELIEGVEADVSLHEQAVADLREFGIERLAEL